MAYRDRSQGFAFVYTDLAKLLRERDKIVDNDHGPVYGPEEKSVNFNKDSQVAKRVAPVAVASEDVIAPAATERNSAIRQIRENLDRLQTLHHKLHSMLDELNTVTDPKKKKS